MAMNAFDAAGSIARALVAAVIVVKPSGRLECAGDFDAGNDMISTPAARRFRYAARNGGSDGRAEANATILLFSISKRQFLQDRQKWLHWLLPRVGDRCHRSARLGIVRAESGLAAPASLRALSASAPA